MSAWGSITEDHQDSGFFTRSQSTENIDNPVFYPSPYAAKPVSVDGKLLNPKPRRMKPVRGVESQSCEATCETSEESFNTLYGCHLWHSASADIVHIVDEKHDVVTVQLSEDFNMYNQLHEPVSIARCGVLAKGLHFASLGAAPQIFHTHIDEDGNNTRMMIGLLTEWRRYYIINLFINAILITILFDMHDDNCKI